jgi:hypothetical protein
LARWTEAEEAALREGFCVVEKREGDREDISGRTEKAVGTQATTQLELSVAMPVPQCERP